MKGAPAVRRANAEGFSFLLWSEKAASCERAEVAAAGGDASEGKAARGRRGGPVGLTIYIIPLPVTVLTSLDTIEATFVKETLK